MKPPFSLLLCILTFWINLPPSSSSITHLPTEVTKNHLTHFLTQFSTSHHIPCFLAGYHVYSSDPKNSKNATGEQRWMYTNGGMANVENGVKCTTETILRVASVSKAIGSGLLAMLVEHRKVHWDDDVHKYVPVKVFPVKTWEGKPVTITLRQLISHQSGLRHTTDADLLHESNFHLTNCTQTISWFAQEPLLYKPGTKFHYSNNGWSLLAAVVEVVEKRPYHLVLNDYLRQIGMKAAQQDDWNAIIPNRGSQYHGTVDTSGGFHLHPAPITDHLRPFPFWPAAGVISNIDDLLTFGNEMLRSYHGWSRSHLKPESIHSLWNYKPSIKEGHQAMTVNGHHYSLLPHRYVLGWWRVDFPAAAHDPKMAHLEMLYHVGNVGGANAIVVVFPGRNVVFGAISNLGGIKKFFPEMAASVYGILRNVQ